MVKINIKSFKFFSHIKRLGEFFFYFYYDITQLHHILLVEMIFFQNVFGNRTGLFSLKTVLSNTLPIYDYENYAKEYTGENNPTNNRFFE